MQLVNKFMMFSMGVNDMTKAKQFYTNKLGLTVTADNRRDDNNWWVSLSFPDGGTSITLTTFHENLKPGTMKLYFSTLDVAIARKELTSKGVKASEIQDDLFGPGSGVKWFDLKDPDENQILVVQT